ncbi:MAG TPA: hypothetical protein VJ161_01555, partial [Geobacteraceae bacterium]|nr:hypothetical protein [Geobacteraceae bacterium]
MKMNFPGIAVLLALLLILPCVSSSAKEQNGAIEGSVYSAETNQPIKDALIRLLRQHPKRPPVR